MNRGCSWFNRKTLCLQKKASRWIAPLSKLVLLELASLSVPSQRDYFSLPSIDLSKYRVQKLNYYATTPSPASRYKLPSLDFQQSQASAYWPGAASSTPATTIQPPQHTLPTPPSDTADGYKLPGQAPNKLATSASQQSGMASNMEPTAAPGSLTARRPAANNLGSMSLPPLPFRGTSTPKAYGYNFESGQPKQTSVVNSGNLLTPPSTLPGDNLSPISSIVNGVNASTNQGLPSFNPGTTSWLQQSTGTTPYGMGTGTTPQFWSNSLKGLFSPSITGNLQRNPSNSPSASEGLPPPPPSFGDLNQVPSFTNPIPSSLPAAAANQHAFAQNFMSQAGQPQTPGSASGISSPPINAQASFLDRPASTPSSYPFSLSQPASAQTSTFPPFNAATSPTQPSPLSAPLTSATRFSPPVGPQSAFPPPNPQLSPYGFRPYPGQIPMPGLPAQLPVGHPVMTNVGNPGTHMALIGMPSGLPAMVPGYHSGHAAQLYGNQQQNPPNDRPFKCDQCPQSFNRNHDLKRHKRIHLAVKPFPCGHCDKSFSRKDALKVWERMQDIHCPT